MLLTGHSAREIHQRYSHHELDRLRDAVAVIPRVNVFGETDEKLRLRKSCDSGVASIESMADYKARVARDNE